MLLRPSFGEKLKIALRSGNSPPQTFEFSVKTFFLEITLIWAEKTFEFPISAEKSVSKSVKTFFFFFGDHLNLGGKNL